MFLGLFALVFVVWAAGFFLLSLIGSDWLMLGLGVVAIVALRAGVDWFCKQAREAISAS